METGLIQVALKRSAEDAPGTIRERNFCPSQDPKWYAAAERPERTSITI